jgi:uncharacterized membrane protein HdeD (DUF308 family)
MPETLPRDATDVASVAAATEADALAAMREQRGRFLVGGILLALAGMFAIGAPVAATFSVAIFLGIALLAGGVAHALHVFSATRFGSGLLRLAIAALYLIAGLYLLLRLPLGVMTIGLVIAIVFVVEGIGRVAQGVQLRPAPGWAWCAAGGIVSAALGVIMWAGWPYTALWIPGLLVGLNLLFYGVTLLGVWASLGRAAPA